jgi:hypothetical protein
VVRSTIASLVWSVPPPPVNWLSSVSSTVVVGVSTVWVRLVPVNTELASIPPL